jgi:hypothetical protein
MPNYTKIRMWQVNKVTALKKKATFEENPYTFSEKFAINYRLPYLATFM